MSRARSLLVSVVAALVLAATAPASPAGTAAVITVTGNATGRPIPPGFLGLSIEYFAIPAYAGTDPNHIDPVFVQLVRNLTDGQPPDLRIGGDTTDSTWWPVPGTSAPAGIKEALTPQWAAITQGLAATLQARLTLGINLEADSTTIAATEADQLVSALGPSRIEALELGNEPELYGSFTWGRSGHTGRPHSYDYAAFSRDFTRIARALPNLPLAGPTSGGPKWFTHVSAFLADHSDVKLTTLHRYPLQLCYRRRNEPDYPTIAHLMTTGASRGLADSVAGAVRASHARHVPIRIDEMNTIGCGSDRAVSESFASALWALDADFNMARVGVDGVNISTFPGATDEPFTFDQTHKGWQGRVMPEYYGLMMFAQAAPPGSRLVTASTTDTPHLKAWATRAADGTTRIVLINEGAHQLAVGVRALGATTAGTLELLTAPSLEAESGVTLGGQSFGTSTTTGLLAGTPNTRAVTLQKGDYGVRLPAASAALLTVPPS